MRSTTTRSGRAALIFLLALLAACDRVDRNEAPLPTEAEAAAFYHDHPDVESVRLSGNVVELRVLQPEAQLRRGGSLWARVGPYIYLFSPGTRALFQGYPGVAAVRTVTARAHDGREVARALLRRDALSDILWRRSLNILGTALQRGTREPARLEDLVGWGERFTEYEYSPAYVPR